MVESKENRPPVTLSFPYAQSHPTHLYSIAKLFGLSPQPVEHAYILEISCLSGGNLIPMAYQFPEANFWGIDKNKKDIELGTQQIKDLNLKNIQLKCNSINNFESTSKKFDYIICQGLYTLSSPDERDKLLQFCHDHLAENGIAYLSYNTLPGWDIAGNLKDILIWHTHALTSAEIKTQQTGAFLKVLLDTVQHDPSIHAASIKNEIYSLARQTSEFVINDYLSDNNKAVYFHEFYEALETHQLTYISDAFLALSYAENLPQHVSEQLKQINNIIYLNQYLDFIRNQRYRSSIICHSNLTLNRKLNTSDVEDYYVQLIGKLEIISKIPESTPPSEENKSYELSDKLIEDANIELKCISPYFTLHATDANMKAALLILAETRLKPLHYVTISEKLFSKSTLKKMDDVKVFLNDHLNLMHCALSGMANLSITVNPFVTEVSEKPAGCPLAQYFAKKQGFTTNRRHQVVALDPMGVVVFELLNGKRTKKDILEIIMKEMEERNLNLTHDDKIPDIAIIKEKIKENIDQVLNNLAQQALLIG